VGASLLAGKEDLERDSLHSKNVLTSLSLTVIKGTKNELHIHDYMYTD
jgi:hypothetical protein